VLETLERKGVQRHHYQTMEITISKRNRDHLLRDCFRFRNARVLKDGDLSWRCIVQTYPARLRIHEPDAIVGYFRPITTTNRETIPEKISKLFLMYRRMASVNVDADKRNIARAPRKSRSRLKTIKRHNWTFNNATRHSRFNLLMEIKFANSAFLVSVC